MSLKERSMNDILLDLQRLGSAIEEKEHSETCFEAIRVIVSLQMALRNVCEAIMDNEPTKPMAEFILGNEYFAEKPDA